MLFWRAPRPASTVHGRFQGQAAAHPRAIALEWDAVRLTYGEVNEAANTLAHRLIEAKVEPDCPVLISMQRSSDLVIAMLAVLKAGGAFVVAGGPLPSGAAPCGFALTDSPRSFHAPGARVISGYVASGTPRNPKNRVEPGNWACEISGRIRSHETVLHNLDRAREEQGFRAGDGMFSAVDLDGDAAMDLLLPLVNGGRLVLASAQEMQDPVLLDNAIRAANCKMIRRPEVPAAMQVARAAFA